MPLALLRDLAVALDAARIPWMVICVQAVLVHGEPRLTRDIDVTVGLSVDRLDELPRLVRGLGWEPLVDAHAFTTETMVLPCRAPGSPLRVDLLLADSPHEAEELRRAQEARERRPDRIAFTTPEDLIVQKVIAGRPRGLEDVRAVLLKHPRLDRPWIRRWLTEYGAPLARPLLRDFDDLAGSI